MVNIGINGFGRIGRNILRTIYENKRRNEVQITAINDLMDIKTAAMLLMHDSVHGKFMADISVDGEYLVVNGDKIKFTAIRNPAELPWKACSVDVVHECTGLFVSKEKAAPHLAAGAKKVIISAPAEGVDATIVYGVNHSTLKATDTIISNASCTTNCLAPLVKPFINTVGLVRVDGNNSLLY